MKKFLLALVLMVPMLAFYGCGGDDEPNFLNSTQTLDAGAEYIIPSNGTWVSSNSLIASVEARTVHALREGEVSISDGQRQFKVVVKPTITIFPTPYLRFHSSKQSVLAYMNGLELDQLTLQSETKESLNYTGFINGSVIGYGYTFEQARLKMSMVAADRTIASTKELGEYLSQRYVPVVNADDYIGMLSPDSKTVVLVEIKNVSGRILYVIAYSEYMGAEIDRADAMEEIFTNLRKCTPGSPITGGQYLISFL